MQTIRSRRKNERRRGEKDDRSNNVCMMNNEILLRCKTICDALHKPLPPFFSAEIIICVAGEHTTTLHLTAFDTHPFK